MQKIRADSNLNFLRLNIFLCCYFRFLNFLAKITDIHFKNAYFMGLIAICHSKYRTVI